MRSFKTIIFIAAILLIPCIAKAQNPSDLKIAEILVDNENGLEDDFGHRNGWIEIFNDSYGTVKFGGCYLTDDISNPKKYHIPAKDAATVVGPRQSVVFYASGNSFQGTFHMNFMLKKGTTIYLVSNDGKTVIDKMAIPENLQTDKSIMRVPCGVKQIDGKIVTNADPTPGTYNGDVDAKTKNEVMKEKDPYGGVLILISVSVVFIALLILAFLFGWIGKATERKGSIIKKSMTAEEAAAVAMALNMESNDEVYAAIAAALDCHLNDGGVHDEESFVITINRSNGSQWNSKVQNFRQSPR